MKTINYLNIFLLSTLFFLVSTKNYAQVGVDIATPIIDLDVNGALSLREGTALVATSGFYSANIILDSNPYSFYRITCPTCSTGDSFGISGIVPSTNTDGQIVTLHNTTNTAMFIAHENATSTAENRILIAGEKDYIIRGKDASITLQYNAIQSRWILVNKLNNAQTWYRNSTQILDGRKTIIVTTGTAITRNTGIVSVSLINNSIPPIPQSELDNIVIEYIEVKDGQIDIRFNNKNPDTAPGGPNWSYVTCSLAITYN